MIVVVSFRVAKDVDVFARVLRDNGATHIDEYEPDTSGT